MNMSSRKLRARATVAAGALLILFFSVLSGTAQTFRGTILGTVSDQSGAVIVGAKVNSKNVATGLERTTETSTDGGYRIPELQIGTYAVTISQTGFQTSVTKDVVVEVAKETRVDATLKPGDVAQRIEVISENLAQVETTSNTLGGSFESKQVDSLPLNGRDYTKLLIMAPGAVGEPHAAGDSPGSFGQFSVNGNRGRANNFLLDGTDMNDGYRNLPAINQGGVFGVPGTILPLESIAELKILADFDAEYGRNSGSVVNIVTRSGTNAFHGSATEAFRNSVLNARNLFNTIGPKDAFRNNQFGAAAGGPIVKDKTFWYAAYEGQREGLAISSLNTVPALSDFQAAIATLPGGNPALCNPGGTIFGCVTNQPVGVVNPVILNLFNFCNTKGKCSGGNNIWPLVNIPNATPGQFNSVAPAPAKNDQDNLIVKIDHSLTAANQLSGRFFYGNSNQSFPLGLGGGNNLPATNTFSPIRTQLVAISLVSEISANKTNEARFGWNRYRNGFFSADASVFGNPLTSLQLNTGVTNPRDFGLPTIRFGSGLFSFLGSSPFSNPRNRVDTNWQFIDGFSWKAGRHAMKFGGEFRRTAVDSFNDFSARGVLVFNALADFLAGTPTNSALFSSRTISNNTDRKARQNNEALYFEDSIHWTKNLTLNLQLRWDYFGIIHEDGGHFSIYDPAVGLAHRDPLYDKDLNNFAPHASVAWDVNGRGKTVVRAGFGVFHDDFSQDAFTGQIYANSFNSGLAYNAIAPDPVILNKSLNAPTLAPGVPVFLPGGNAQTTDASTVDKHLRTPYVYNFNLNIQREIARNTVFQIGYVGSAGHKLLRLHDINQPTVAQIDAADLANPCAAPNAALACIIDFGAPRNFSTPLTPPGGPANNAPFIINQLESSANSNYHSLQTTLSQRNWHGLSQAITYVWSHSIDTASDSQDYVPNAATPADNTNIRMDKGPSNFDVRNHFVWSGDYDLPKWETAGRMGEGWSLSGVLTIQSGHPFHLNYNGIDDFSGGGSGFDRPDVVGPIRYNYHDPSHFLDLSAFAVPCTFLAPADPRFSGDGFADSCTAGTRHFGTLGRNALIGPHYRNFDFAIIKDTRLTERFKLQFRTDIYNLFNHPNLSNPLLPAFLADAAPNRSNLPQACAGSAGLVSAPTGINGVTGQSCGFYAISATSDAGVGNPILGGGGPRSIQFALKVTF